MARADGDTDLSRVDLRTLEAKPLIPEARAALKAAIERVVTNPHMRASALGRLAPVLARPPPAWTPGALPQDKRHDVLASENLPDDDPVQKLTNGEALVSPRDDGTYGKALAEELARLACAMENAGIVSRLGGRMGDFDEGAYLPDFARRVTASCPGLIAKLGPDDRKSWLMLPRSREALQRGLSGRPGCPARVRALRPWMPRLRGA